MTAGYTPAKGRKFAFTLAIAFAVLATVSLWRGRHIPPLVLGTLAVAFLLGGVVFPARLEPVERGWMAMAHLISRVTTPIFMGIVYFVILTPIGIVRRLFGGNAMVHKEDAGSYWVKRPEMDAASARRRMERQF